MSGKPEFPRWVAYVGNCLDKWPFDQSRLDFHHMGRVIDASAEVPGKGWVLLWHDEKGYTVSHTSTSGAGTGGVVDLPTALDDFRQALDSILWKVRK